MNRMAHTRPDYECRKMPLLFRSSNQQQPTANNPWRSWLTRGKGRVELEAD